MLKSEVALACKSLCHKAQPITTMLFGDELLQSISNILQVKQMAAKSIAMNVIKRALHNLPTLVSRNLVLIRIIIADLVIMARVI